MGMQIMKVLFLTMDDGSHGKSDIILKKEYENISYLPKVDEVIKVQYGDSNKEVGEYKVNIIKKEFLKTGDEITIYLKSLSS